MGDYIANRHTFFEVCPNCRKKKLRVTEWEEHLEGWGIQSYKVEYFRKAHCTNEWCQWEES